MCSPLLSKSTLILNWGLRVTCVASRELCVSVQSGDVCYSMNGNKQTESNSAADTGGAGDPPTVNRELEYGA